MLTRSKWCHKHHLSNAQWSLFTTPMDFYVNRRRLRSFQLTSHVKHMYDNELEVLFVTLYLHRFQGSLAAGDQFIYGWHSNSIRSLSAAQLAAVTWNQTLWNGSVAGNGLKDHLTAGVSMLNVFTVSINPATGKQIARVDTAQVIAGVAAGNALPADTSLVVSMRSDVATRAGRGRFYLPQPAASEVTSTGRVLADLVNDVNASLFAAWTNYNTASDRPVLYHRLTGTTDNVTTFNIPDLYGCQRRRENKVVPVRTSSAMP